MPKVVTYADAMSNHGSLYVFCTSSETEKIADVTERAGSWINIFSSALDPASMIAIRAVAVFIPWKARRCLKHNKCLMISVAPISTLHEYDPYDSNDGWYKIYSSLFLVPWRCGGKPGPGVPALALRSLAGGADLPVLLALHQFLYRGRTGHRDASGELSVVCAVPQRCRRRPLCDRRCHRGRRPSRRLASYGRPPQRHRLLAGRSDAAHRNRPRVVALSAWHRPDTSRFLTLLGRWPPSPAESLSSGVPLRGVEPLLPLRETVLQVDMPELICGANLT